MKPNNQLSARDRYNAALKLKKLCTDTHTFRFENLLCYGESHVAIKKFLDENSGIGFRDWLIANNMVISFLKFE